MTGDERLCLNNNCRVTVYLEQAEVFATEAGSDKAEFESDDAATRR